MNLALPEIEQPVRLRFDRPMTDEELLRFCAENEMARIERDANGELIVMSPTGMEGGGVEGDVFGELRNWALEDRRGKAYGPNAGFTLPDSSVRAADASWVSWPRVNALTPEQREGFAPICPEFIIEVRSASDRLEPLQEKMRMWIANGAELAWLVDPLRKTVEVYRLGSKHADVLEGVTAVYGEGPVGGFVLELVRIWA
ncbi:MAG TPA: Uma2 family endonuclease [Acidobacteriaceae bacterium]|nr:Uma2 family endonuclease [Acidobacteriaceae bacterium]